MKRIRIIAINTFREIIRDRILYGILVFALLLIGFSLALGQLSFAEQARISADFGFTGIQMSTSILAIFAGSTLVSREIEKQTVLTLLARPVTRTQFLLGKFAGLTLVVSCVMVGLATVVGSLLALLSLPINASFFVALWGVFLEATLLIAVVLFFGSFAKPAMTVIFAVALFLIGHWIDSLGFFIEHSESGAFKFGADAVSKIVPNLERFNWRAAPIYSTRIPAYEVLTSTAYAFGWVCVLMAATALIFRRRDFV